MKKFLAIFIALILVTSANAALSLVSSAGDTIQVGNTTQIGVYNDTQAPNQGLLLYVVINEADTGKAHWTENWTMNVPPAPVAGTADYYGLYAGYGDMWYWEPGVSVDDYLIGSMADFEFQCDAVGDVTITLYAEDAVTVMDTLTITQVPEPMTIGLLGLGVLFLRRKKMA